MEGVVPSFFTGFARNAGECKYPEYRRELTTFWCPFIGATGTKLIDYSGNGNVGTATGAITFAPGKSGLAVESDGNTGFIETANNLWTTRGAFLTRFRIDTIANDDTLYQEKAAGRIDVDIRSAGGGTLRIRYEDTDTDFISYSIDPLVAGQWYDLLVTWDTSTIEFYVDGVLKSSQQFSGLHGSTTTVVLFSARNNLNIIDGAIEFAYYWQRKLKAAEALFLHNNPYAPVEMADTPIGKVAVGATTTSSSTTSSTSSTASTTSSTSSTASSTSSTSSTASTTSSTSSTASTTSSTSSTASSTSSTASTTSSTSSTASTTSSTSSTASTTSSTSSTASTTSSTASSTSSTSSTASSTTSSTSSTASTTSSTSSTSSTASTTSSTSSTSSTASTTSSTSSSSSTSSTASTTSSTSSTASTASTTSSTSSTSTTTSAPPATANMQVDATTATMNPLYATENLGSRLIEKDLEVWGVSYVAGKSKRTLLGGYAILLTNKTGGVSVAGELVSAHTSIADAVEQSPTTSATTVGLFESSGISDGDEAWVVGSGIAVVHMDNNSVSLGDRVVSSTTIAGRGLASNTPSNTAHFTEIGHCIQAGAANSTVRCVIHFN